MFKSVFSGGFRRERRKSMPGPEPGPSNDARQSRIQTSPERRPSDLPLLSGCSSAAVPNAAWSSQDFLLGAGMVVIQPSTRKIVVLHEKKLKYWFFPRGRKDVGESLEQTALREAYEESGYRVSFCPILNPTHQPVAPDTQVRYLNTEAVFMTITAWQPRKRRNGSMEPHGGEYLTFWYVGEIPEGAVAHSGTGMADEQNYETFLLDYDEAMESVSGSEKYVLQYAWALFCNTEQALKSQNQDQTSPFVESPDEIIPSSPTS